MTVSGLLDFLLLDTKEVAVGALRVPRLDLFEDRILLPVNTEDFRYVK